MPGASEEKNIEMLYRASKLHDDFMDVLKDAQRKYPDKDFSEQKNRASEVFQLALYISNLHSQVNYWKNQFLISQTDLAKHEQALIDVVDELNKLKESDKW